MIKLLIFSSFLLTACGQSPQNTVQGQVIDKDFTVYVIEFEQQAKQHSKHIDDSKLQIQYGVVSKDLYAVCNIQAMGIPVITVASDFMQQDELIRQMIIFHELGHCLLGRGHDEDFVDNAPVSLMNHALLTEVEWTQNQAYYLNELFK